MEKLHPGAKWIIRLHAYGQLLFYYFFIAFFFLRIAADMENESFLYAVFLGQYAIYWIVAFIAILIIAEIYTQLSYANREYNITKTEIRVNKGIIWKKSTSIPYEKVQNIDIERGIIARMMGFSEVMIQTAGNSGPYNAKKNYKYTAEGYLPGVSMDAAEKIASQIIDNIEAKKSKDV